MPPRDPDPPGGRAASDSDAGHGDKLDIDDLPLVGPSPTPSTPPADEAVTQEMEHVPDDLPSELRRARQARERAAVSAAGQRSEDRGQESKLDAGDVVSGVRLVELIAAGQRVSCWRGESADRTTVTVHVLTPAASDTERQTFLKGASRMGTMARDNPERGIATVVKVVPGAAAYVTDVAAAGTMEDLPMLNWGLPDKISFLRRVCTTLGAVHASGHAHGCLRPAGVLLDEELEPVMCDIGVVQVRDSFPGAKVDDNDYAPYTAPEVRKGAVPDARSDIYGAGRLLYFLLIGRHPAERDEEIPKLEALSSVPEGLSRIVRRCTVLDPARRYGAVDELLGDIAKYQHADIVGLPAPGAGTAAAAKVPVKPVVERDTGAAVRAPVSMRPRSAALERAAASVPPRVVAETRSRRAADASVVAVDAVTPMQRGLIGLGGAALLAAGLGMSYVTGFDSLAANGLTVVGLVGLSVLLPVLASRPLVSRGILAMLCAVAGMLLAPTSYLAKAGRLNKLSSGNPQTRVAALTAFKERGFSEFVGVDLSDADLSNMDLANLVLDQGKFAGARFQRTRLQDTSFVGSDLTHADFSGADLRGVDVASATGWQSAKCDPTTRMPAAWRCSNGAPVSTHAVGADSDDTAEAEAPAPAVP